MRITEKSTENVVFFPKNIQKSQQFHNILLHSELTNKDYIIDNLVDNDNLYDYYKFECNFSNIPDGEYKYIIDDNMATGLIILGNVKRTINEVVYSEDPKYIVYDND